MWISPTASLIHFCAVTTYINTFQHFENFAKAWGTFVSKYVIIILLMPHSVFWFQFFNEIYFKEIANNLFSYTFIYFIKTHCYIASSCVSLHLPSFTKNSKISFQSWKTHLDVLRSECSIYWKPCLLIGNTQFCIKNLASIFILKKSFVALVMIGLKMPTGLTFTRDCSS